MNLKDQINFIAIQEQVVNMMMKVNVIEKLLIEKKVVTAEEYNGELVSAATKLAEQLKPLYEQVEKLQETVKLANQKINKEDVQ